jgi:hypothetical protein
MLEPRPPRSTPKDQGAWRPSIGYLVVALVLVAGGLAAWWNGEAAPGPIVQDGSSPAALPVAPSEPVTVAAAEAGPPSPARGAAPPPTTGPVSPPAPRVVRHRDPRGDQTPDLADFINDGDIPTTAEVIERLHAAGVHEGLGAFQPPGTRPPLVGLAVPEGFVLPDGYVRHYQATDDGQRIEPILMFSPDHQFFDADHRPVAIPMDRVVPPELAPPGLPIRRIAIPSPVDTASPGG